MYFSEGYVLQREGGVEAPSLTVYMCEKKLDRIRWLLKHQIQSFVLSLLLFTLARITALPPPHPPRSWAKGKSSLAAVLLTENTWSGDDHASILHSTQSLFQGHAKADILLESGHCHPWTSRVTMAGNGLRPHAMYPDLLSRCYIHCLLKSTSSSSALPVLSASTPHSPGRHSLWSVMKIHSLPPQQWSHTWANGCPSRDRESRLGGAMTKFFSSGLWPAVMWATFSLAPQDLQGPGPPAPSHLPW